MAGIGFELKKVFKERSVANLLRGAFYSTFTIIGPMLIIIICFMLLFFVMEYQYIDYETRDLLASIILYVFIFSLVLTSPLAAVISRYIADKIFEERPDHIMPCYYTGLMMNVALGFVACAPFCIATVILGGVEPHIMLISGCMFMSLLFVFYNMTFITAIKEYRSIVMTFLTAMIFTIMLGYLLYQIIGIDFLVSILIAMTSGFMIVGFTLFSLVKKFFTENSGNYKDFMTYIKRYKLLFVTNMFYILGLYVHNFVFWAVSPFKIVVAATFHSAPPYDTATFLAMMTNITTTVLFTVRVEVNFHDRYQQYCQQLLGGIGTDIIISKNKMFQTLIKETVYIVMVQTVITIIVFLLLSIFGSFFGFGGTVLALYPSLAAGYFIIFVMYSMIIFLYYYDDSKGAVLSAFAFFIGTLVGALIAVNLRISLNGLGPFIGAFCGWTVAFLRLRYIERSIDRQMYCKGDLIRRVYSDPQGNLSMNPMKRFRFLKQD